MEKQDNNAGLELLSLLRQQRYLYHQLKLLTDRQQQLRQTDSPELLLEVIFGRRKLVEKLRQLNSKLRPIKANWQKLSVRIGPEYEAQAEKMANQVQGIISQISADAQCEMTRELPLYQERIFEGVLAES